MVQVTREQHVCPPEIQETLTRAGGTNQFGEPNFRAVWGYSRLGWMGGRWVDRDAQGNPIRECFQLRQVPKAMPHSWNRWIIESYRGPEFYGARWLWEMQTRIKDPNSGAILQSLGPHPSRGDYEHSQTVEKACAECLASFRAGNEKAIANCEHWEFVQLNSYVVHKIAKMIMRCREANAAETKAIAEAQAQREMALEDMAADEIIESAQSQNIPKHRQDYLDRFVAPAIERMLARGMKRRRKLSPETQAVLDRGRSRQVQLAN
jgi:hypothetical protein